MSAALLSRERELWLARLWRDAGDEAALHELVMAYMRLVISTAGSATTVCRWATSCRRAPLA